MDGSMLGKIKKVDFGFDTDNRYGLFLSLGSEQGAWGVEASYHVGESWAKKAKPEDIYRAVGEMSLKIMELLRAAKCLSVNDLVNKPVEATFKDNTLKSWRILTEVL